MERITPVATAADPASQVNRSPVPEPLLSEELDSVQPSLADAALLESVRV